MPGILLVPDFLSVGTQVKPSDSAHTSTLFLFLVLAGLAPFIVGALLWILAPRIAKWTLGNSEASVPASPVTPEELQTIAYVSLGAVLLVSTLPRIIGILIAALKDGNPGYVLLRAEDFFTAVGVAILGMALSFGGRFFTRLLKRLRS